MPLPLNRIIIFVRDVQKCARFYIDVFGFTPVGDADSTEWVELETGGCRLAMHACGKGKSGGADGGEREPHKIVFFAKDVEKARAEVVKRGAIMAKVQRFGTLVMCAGKDVEGHVFQISNRK